MENILENNKLMAEFLEFNLTTDGIQILYYNKQNSLKALPKFHSDWNWLMEVVEKIENWQEKQYYVIHSMYFNKRSVSIKAEHNRTFKNIEIHYEEGEKLKATYNACVEFIKWYNEQK